MESLIQEKSAIRRVMAVVVLLDFTATMIVIFALGVATAW
jgi:hypothetical protein